MSDSESTQVKNKLSPGKQLSQARLQLGLTQEQVAKELYITLSKIKALESDDYNRLNIDTFARGYIRAYANLVKLDVVDVLAAYDQLTQEKIDDSETDVIVKIEAAAPVRSSKVAMQFLLIIGIFFLGLWLISVWFFDNHQDKNYSEVGAPEATFAAASENNLPLQAEDLSLDGDNLLNELSATQPVAADSLASSSTVASSLEASTNEPSVISSAAVKPVMQSAAATEPVPASNGLDTIVLTFKGECWLEVSDSRGDVLATELQAGGSKITLVGKAPFDVKLGNAPMVDIQLNNKKVDVIPLLGSNVLTLRVQN